MKSAFTALPVELVYRILDNLTAREIFDSMANVCARMNAIIQSYQPYRVNLWCITNDFEPFENFESIVCRH